MGEPTEYDGTNDDVLDPFVINNDCLIHLLKNTEQPAELNVRMIMDPGQENDGETDDDDDNDSSTGNDDDGDN